MERVGLWIGGIRVKEAAKTLIVDLTVLLVGLPVCDDILEYSGVIAPLHRRPAEAMDLYVLVPLRRSVVAARRKTRYNKSIKERFGRWPE